MKIYFKNGFYFSNIHQAIPQDAVEISAELHRTLILGQSQGRQIVTGRDGIPTLTDPRPSEYHEWDGEKWAIEDTKQTQLLAEEKARVRAEINRTRDEKINGGVFVEAVNKWIDSDATAERNLIAVKASFDLFGESEIAWTCADNSVLMMNKESLMKIWEVLLNSKTGNHANALRHKEAMEQSDDPKNYDYSTGWSKTYQDYLKTAETKTEQGVKQ